MKRYVNCNYFINLMFSEDVPYQFASLRAYKMPFPRVILSQVLSPSCCKRSSSSSNALVKVAFCWSTVGWRVSSCHASSWFQLPVKACKIHQGKKYQVRKKGCDFRRPLKCSTWIQRRQKGDSISIQSPSPCISKRMLKQTSMGTINIGYISPDTRAEGIAWMKTTSTNPGVHDSLSPFLILLQPRFHVENLDRAVEGNLACRVTSRVSSSVMLGARTASLVASQKQTSRYSYLKKQTKPGPSQMHANNANRLRFP